MSERRLAELVEALRGEVGVELDGDVYRLPPLTALDWAAALLDGGPDAILPGLLPAEQATVLYDRLLDEYDDGIDLSVVEEAGLWLLEQAAHRPWWEARRALLHALDSWAVFEAWCTHACGVDARGLPVDRFCNLVVRFYELHLEDNDREQWRMALTAPPPGVDLESRPEWADEAVAADTASAMNEWAAMQAQIGSASPD